MYYFSHVIVERPPISCADTKADTESFPGSARGETLYYCCLSGYFNRYSSRLSRHPLVA